MQIPNGYPDDEDDDGDDELMIMAIMMLKHGDDDGDVSAHLLFFTPLKPFPLDGSDVMLDCSHLMGRTNS